MRSAIVVPALAALAVLVGAPAALAQSCVDPPPPCISCDAPPPDESLPPPPPGFTMLRAGDIGDVSVSEATPAPDAKFKIDIGGPADGDLTITYRTVDG